MNSGKSMLGARRRVTLGAVAVCGLLVFAAPSAAATLTVSTTGTDSAACGPVGGPCASLAQAVTNASSGDSIIIGAGTFPVRGIAITAKSLDIGGAGVGQTILDGGNVTNSGQNGMLRFNPSSGTRTQRVHDLSFVRVARSSATARRFAIVAQPQGGPVAGRAVDLTVEDVSIAGSGAGAIETGIYSAVNTGSVVVRRANIANFAGNTVLLERQLGPVTIADSTLRTVTNDFGIYDFTYSGAMADGRRTISGNTFSGAAGIGVAAGFAGTIDAAFRGGYDIAGNQIGSTGTGISVSNASVNATGGTADVIGLNIAGNTIEGAGAGTGVIIRGRITAPLVTRNAILSHTTGVLVAPKTPEGHSASGTVVSFNRIIGPAGVSNTTGAAVDARENWWGCNAGPGNAGCSTVSGSTSFNPWLILELEGPSQATIGQAVTMRARLTRNSDGLDHAATGRTIPDGAPVAFDATGGTLTDPAATLTAGIAPVTFTPAGAGSAEVGATVDGQRVTRVISVPAPPANGPTGGGGPVSPGTPTPTADVNGPLIGASRVPSRCLRSGPLTVRFSVRDASRIRQTAVFLDGRRVRLTNRSTRKARFTHRVRIKRLRPGLHRLTVRATDRAGNRSRRSVWFRVCAPRREVSPPARCSSGSARVAVSCRRLASSADVTERQVRITPPRRRALRPPS